MDSTEIILGTKSANTDGNFDSTEIILGTNSANTDGNFDSTEIILGTKSANTDENFDSTEIILGTNSANTNGNFNSIEIILGTKSANTDTLGGVADSTANKAAPAHEVEPTDLTGGWMSSVTLAEASQRINDFKASALATFANTFEWQHGLHLSDADREAGYRYVMLLDGSYVRARYGGYTDTPLEIHPDDWQLYQDAMDRYYKGILYAALLPGLGKVLPGLKNISLLKNKEVSNAVTKTEQVAVQESSNAAVQAERVAQDVGKVPNAKNYRELFLKENPEMPLTNQVHHTLPQKYEEILNASGKNIHETQYLEGIDPKVHSKITSEWTRWEKSLGRTPTAEEVIDFAKQIDSKYGGYWYNK